MTEVTGGRRPGTVTALTVLLVLQAATGFCLAGLSLVVGIASWLSRDRAGNGFADLAAVIAGMMTVFAGVGLALAVLAWMALRARRTIARPLAIAVFAMPLVGVLLVGLLRSSLGAPMAPAVLLALAWAGLGAWLSLTGATAGWLQSPPVVRA